MLDIYITREYYIYISYKRTTLIWASHSCVMYKGRSPTHVFTKRNGAEILATTVKQSWINQSLLIMLQLQETSHCGSLLKVLHCRWWGKIYLQRTYLETFAVDCFLFLRKILYSFLAHISHIALQLRGSSTIIVSKVFVKKWRKKKKKTFAVVMAAPKFVNGI